MDNKITALLAVTILCVAGACGFALKSASADTEPESDTLYQVSLLQDLMFGDYTGSITVGELKQHGSVGIGTFDGLNGELIMLNGVVYRAAVGENDTCSVTVVEDSETVPFANTANMKTDFTATGLTADSMDAMKTFLTNNTNAHGANSMYFAVIHAKFSSLTVRSEYAQSEPYKPLAKVLETDQREWTRSDVTGTIVALYCPVYLDKVNTPGWHLHFISDDRSFGGHVLDLSVSDAKADFNKLTNFVMVTPDTERFQGFDFSKDQSDDIAQVEG